jgi:hypothetical protein
MIFVTYIARSTIVGSTGAHDFAGYNPFVNGSTLCVRNDRDCRLAEYRTQTGITSRRTTTPACNDHVLIDVIRFDCTRQADRSDVSCQIKLIPFITNWGHFQIITS